MVLADNVSDRQRVKAFLAAAAEPIAAAAIITIRLSGLSATHEGKAVPAAVFGKVARITSSNSALSAGF
jgi:hypothetical protein